MEILILMSAVVIIWICVLVYEDKKYKETTYFQITKHPYSLIKRDKGKYGEFLIYRYLRYLEGGNGKFLFNLYIPKANNETSEIDVLLVCSKGLFVFESKNYSGWIFGNEMQKNWMQTLPISRGLSHKERFYNPIMQNAAHIKHLKRIVGDNMPIRSIIVFSDRCTLKDITIKSRDVHVINCSDILSVVNQIYNQEQGNLLRQTEIDDIYNKLYPYTQINHEVSQHHISNIKKI